MTFGSLKLNLAKSISTVTARYHCGCRVTCSLFDGKMLKWLTLIYEKKIRNQVIFLFPRERSVSTSPIFPGKVAVIKSE